MPADGEYTFWTHVLHDKKKREKSLRDDRRLTGSAKNLNITVLLDTINVSFIGHYQCQFYWTLTMSVLLDTINVIIIGHYQCQFYWTLSMSVL